VDGNQLCSDIAIVNRTAWHTILLHFQKQSPVKTI
jgi:hypothetical protein